MEYTDTDYLFILSLYDDDIPLSRLLFHLAPSGAAERTDYLAAKADLAELEGKGLVALTTKDGADQVRLTNYGRSTASSLAAAMAEEVVRGWQTQTLSFHTPYGQPA